MHGVPGEPLARRVAGLAVRDEGRDAEGRRLGRRALRVHRTRLRRRLPRQGRLRTTHPHAAEAALLAEARIQVSAEETGWNARNFLSTETTACQDNSVISVW